MRGGGGGRGGANSAFLVEKEGTHDYENFRVWRKSKDAVLAHGFPPVECGNGTRVKNTGTKCPRRRGAEFFAEEGKCSRYRKGWQGSESCLGEKK